MNTVWTKDTPTTGNTIVLRRKDVEWASYDLPSTSHSGGGAQIYQFGDIFEGSGFYNSVVAVFGLSVAQEILSAVQNRSQITEHVVANDSESAFIKWLNTVPEDEKIPVPWQSELKKFEFAQRDFSGLEKIGIHVKKSGHHCQIFDAVLKTPLFLLMFTDTFDYAEAPNHKTRILCTRTELFVVISGLHSVHIISPFENWKNDWKNLCSEISQPHLLEDGFLLRFNLVRLTPSDGDYILKIDFSGKVLAKRDITNR